ncbi:MAG: hypothetical protein ACLS3M_03770 [Collinsella sp.]
MELNASNPSNTMDRPLITYYSELGTVSKGTLDDEPDGFVYSLPSQDLLYDSFDSIQEQIHSRLIDLDNHHRKIVRNQSTYYSIIHFCPIAISEGGFSPEMTFDRDSFAGYAKRFSFEESAKAHLFRRSKVFIRKLWQNVRSGRGLTEDGILRTREIEPIGNISTEYSRYPLQSLIQ